MFGIENFQDLVFATFAGIICFAVFMVIVSRSQRESTSQRLKRLAPTKEEAKEFIDRNREGQPKGMAATLEPLLSMLALRPAEFRRVNFYRFYRAGVDAVDGPTYYLAWKWMGLPVALLIVTYLITRDAQGAMKLLNYLLSIMVFSLTFFGGDLYLKNQRDKRALKLTRAFPDTLDLLLVCTESGLALDGALARVCKELDRAYPEITDELNKTRLELTLLNDRSRALQNLADRTDLVPFRSLIASLLQTERFGTSLTETLRVLADEYRNTRLMLAEEKAGKLPVKITIPLVTLLLPSLFLIIMGPAIIKAMEVL
jgi:tight adherence protein C